KFFPRSRLGRAFSIDLPGVTPAMPSHEELTGATGKAVTMLRPSGTAMIGGRRVDVTTEGGMIEQGADIKVAKVDGARIIVRRL
ncbi:MAG: NfeD family protein, partial [Verrucomicrobiia bacterium]